MSMFYKLHRHPLINKLIPKKIYMNLKSTSKISKFIKILILTIIRNYFQFNKKNQIKVCNLKKKKIKNI